VKTYKDNLLAGTACVDTGTAGFDTKVPARSAPARRPPSVARRFLSYNDLLERGIPFGRVHLRRLEIAGLFPKRVCLGSGNGTQASVAWVFEEVVEWENQRLAERGPKKMSRPSVPQHTGAAAASP
jgi:prophage regulatory protein